MRTTSVRNLVKGWYQRARAERDPVSKFVFLWFCFNAWLAYESDEDQDWRMLEWLKVTDEQTSDLRRAYERALRSDTYRRYLDSLVRLSPIERSGRRVGEVVKIESSNQFNSILDGIYVVRCNLFHGTKGPTNVRDQKLVRVCASILYKWVGNLVGQWKRAA